MQTAGNKSTLKIMSLNIDQKSLIKKLHRKKNEIKKWEGGGRKGESNELRTASLFNQVTYTKPVSIQQSHDNYLHIYLLPWENQVTATRLNSREVSLSCKVMRFIYWPRGTWQQIVLQISRVPHFYSFYYKYESNKARKCSLFLTK